MVLLEARISIAKLNASGECIRCSSCAFSEKCKYADSSIDETTSGELLCSFAVFERVYAVRVQASDCVAISAQHAMPAKIIRHTIGHRAGSELLFISLMDKTVRAFSVGTDAINAIAQIAFNDSPCRLPLWLPEHELLLVSLWNASKKADAIEVLRVASSEKTLEKVGRALDVDSAIDVRCWLETAENEVLIFDGNQSELVKLAIQAVWCARCEQVLPDPANIACPCGPGPLQLSSAFTDSLTPPAHCACPHRIFHQLLTFCHISI